MRFGLARLTLAPAAVSSDIMGDVLRRLCNFVQALSLLFCATILVLWVWTERRVETVSPTRGTRTWSLTSFAGGVRLLEIDGTFAAPGVEHVSQRWPPGMFRASRWPAGVSTASVTWVRPLMGGLQPSYGFVFARLPCWGLNPCESWGPNPLEKWKQSSVRVVVVPYWFLCACFAIPLLRRARTIAAYVLAERRIPGRCRCGYDLRATPERCPECGATVARIAEPIA